MGRKVEEGYDPSGDGSGMGGLLGGTGTGAGPTSPWYWNLRIYNGYGASSGVPTPSANTNSYTLWMRVKIVLLCEVIQQNYYCHNSIIWNYCTKLVSIKCLRKRLLTEGGTRRRQPTGA